MMRRAKPKYCRPADLTEALEVFAGWKEKAALVAGGTDLVGRLKSNLVSPSILMNIKTVAGLDGISKDQSGLRIGPLMTIADVAASPVVKTEYPLLAEAANSVAGPQIRNMGTVGGNLCQEVRCWYYRRPPSTGKNFRCHRKGGNTCYAIQGFNRDHAVIGGKKCFSVFPSDIAVALVSLGGTVRLQSTHGQREVPVEEFYTPLGHILEPAELVTDILVPSPPPFSKQRFLKFRIRKTIDFSIVSVAVMLAVEKGVVTGATVTLGGVSPVPYKAAGVERALVGQRMTGDVISAAAKAAMVGAKPLSHNFYKLALSEALVKRAMADI